MGVGYKVNIIKENANTLLEFRLGFSHLIRINVPKYIYVFSTKFTELSLLGIDKNAVTQFAAQIRNLKKPDVYKGKGIRFKNEVLVLREGKKNK